MSTPADRRFYASAPWRAVRAEVLERDDYRCQICQNAAATEVDHIIPRTEAPALELEPGNLRAACRHCNGGRARKPHRVGVSQRRPSRRWT